MAFSHFYGYAVNNIGSMFHRTNFGFDGGGIQIDLQQQWIGDFTELGKIEDWR